MPWNVTKDDRCPTSKPYAVVKEGGDIEGCHESKEAAEKQQAALYASEKGRSLVDAFVDGMKSVQPIEEQAMPDQMARPPRDNLARAVYPGAELQSSDDGPPILRGYFSVFNDWYPVDSVFEGKFMESVASGAFTKAINESKRSLQALYDHGQDPTFGRKPLGPIKGMGEDDRGAWYEVELLDTSYNRDLLPGLRSGVYGSSFRFNVVKDDFDPGPQRSAYNPDQLPERKIREVKLLDIGPTPFPVNPSADAGVRSMTDELVISQLARDPERLRSLLTSKDIALPLTEPTPVTPEGSRKVYPSITREAFLEKIHG